MAKETEAHRRARIKYDTANKEKRLKQRWRSSAKRYAQVADAEEWREIEKIRKESKAQGE